MSSHGQFQVHQRLDVRMVEMKDALAKIEQAERGHDPDHAQHRRDPQHQAHVPCLGLFLVLNVVIRDGKNGSIVQHGNHHDHHCGHGIKIKYQDRQRHEEEHAQRFGDAIDRIAVHPLENAAAFLDRVDDHREAGRQQHDGRRRTSRIRRAGNGDAAVRFLQRRSVVHAVAGHADDVAALLQNFHNVEFVFRKYLSEAVRFFDGLRDALSR